MLGKRHAVFCSANGRCWPMQTRRSALAAAAFGVKADTVTPKADIERALFDHLVRGHKQSLRHGDAEALGNKSVTAGLVR
jgi:hypothetical protein